LPSVPLRTSAQSPLGKVEGPWVSFVADNASDALTAFTARGPWADGVVFDRIQFPAGTLATAAIACHAWDTSGDLRVVSRDAPGAPLTLRNAGSAAQTVTLTAPTGVALAALPNGTGVTLTLNGHEGVLRVARGATASIAGQAITLTLPKRSGAEFHLQPQGRMGMGARIHAWQGGFPMGFPMRTMVRIERGPAQPQPAPAPEVSVGSQDGGQA
jgi:hypothetical protein